MLIDHRVREELYFTAIREGFLHCQLGVEEQTRVVQWLDEAIAHRLDNVLIEQVAREILEAYPHLTGGDAKRYQFKATSQKNELIKIIFDSSFKKATNEGATERIIQLAQAASVNQNAFYPTWKKVVHIYLPLMAGATLGSPLSRIFGSYIVAVKTINLISACYDKITHVTARVVVPFVINNTPIYAIRLCNKLTDIIIRIHPIVIQVLLVCMLAKWVISKLGILPSVTRILNQIDFYKIYCAIPVPMSVLAHLIGSVFQAVIFANSLCTRVSVQLNSMAASGTHHRLTISSEKAFEVWNTIIRNKLEPV